MAKFGEGSSGDPVDVRKVLDTGAFEQLCLWVEDGALISLATTKDRGALGVTVTVDGEWERTYVRHDDELTEWATQMAPLVKQALADARASAEREPRSRRRKGL